MYVVTDLSKNHLDNPPTSHYVTLKTLGPWIIFRIPSLFPFHLPLYNGQGKEP